MTVFCPGVGFFACPFSGLTRTALAGGIVLLAGDPVWANCSPQSQIGVIATCTGAIFNQGDGPEHTNFSGNGYGDILHSGLTVIVDDNASFTGIEWGAWR